MPLWTVDAPGSAGHVISRTPQSRPHADDRESCCLVGLHWILTKQPVGSLLEEWARTRALPTRREPAPVWVPPALSASCESQGLRWRSWPSQAVRLRR